MRRPAGLLSAVALVALVALGSLATAADPLESEIALAARAGRFREALPLLAKLQERDPNRYADGRFDYLTARALLATGKPDEALPRFERFVAPDDLFDVPARLAAASVRFSKGEATRAFDLLLPLLQRRDSAVARRALRITLDALETRLDAPTLLRLGSIRTAMATRERRRFLALRAEAYDLAGAGAEAEKLRMELLSEARRDDAAAVVLARELRGRTPTDLPDPLLKVLVDTARSQRDMELAYRLAVERDRRAVAGRDVAERWAARFELSRLLAARGKFVEAADGFRSILASQRASAGAVGAPVSLHAVYRGARSLGDVVPARLPKRGKAKRKKGSPGAEDTVGSPAFFGRVRFNLAAMLERLGDLDGAVREFQGIQSANVGPVGLTILQWARLEIRRGALDRAEGLLGHANLSKEAGWVEGHLLLVLHRCESKDARGAGRVLARVEAHSRAGRLGEPWKSELPFWRGRVEEAAGNTGGALAAYTAVLSRHPYSAAGEIAAERASKLSATSAFARDLRQAGEQLLTRSEPRAAKEKLLPAAVLGDAPARDLLKLAYQQLPGYAEVLLAPELPDESLPGLCGDAAACRLLQLGLPEEAEPIVRDARRLDSLLGCILAARLAEQADAGPAALEAAEALNRRVPDDFLLDLAPRSVLRGLAPRPFDRQVIEASDASGVPRDLLYAVMRQESRFDREAASPAAARGLMQLTLPAAGEAARELNEAPPAYADLYDPAKSLRLGARTLRGLLDRFASHPAPVVAAYNAGAGQTALWCGNARSPAEALLASISYAETRTYYRRVLANRSLYRLASGG